MILLAISLAIQAPYEASGMNVGQNVYFGCVELMAEKLEKSKEPASTVAEVALSKCETALEGAYQDYIYWFRHQPDIVAYEADGKTYTNYARLKPQNLESIRKIARQKAINVVVEKRAS